MRRWTPLLGMLLLAAGCRPAAPIARPNVLLVTLDTTRADHLGIYGHTRDTSPNLDALAREGAWFERAYTTATWTLPAHASLFTGLHPKTHGAQYDPAGAFTLGDVIPGPQEFRELRARGLDAGDRTLATLLGAAGYRTAAVVAGPWMKQAFGLGAGFEHYDDAHITNANGRRARDVTKAAIEWIDGLGPDPSAPFFLFLNYFDAHSPYNPPRQCLDAIAAPAERPEGETTDPAALLILYDAEILCVDRQLGRLFAHLQQRGLYDATWVIVTADHGEMMGEHGVTGHGKTLYEPELHVPLVVKPPRGEGPHGAQRDLVQISDLHPWILSRAGVPVPAGTQGAFPPGARPALADVDRPQIGARGRWRAILEGDWKLLENGEGARELYDVASDPAEADDRAAVESERGALLAGKLSSAFAAMPAPTAATKRAAELDDETRRALESLGYVHETRPEGDAAPKP